MTEVDRPAVSVVIPTCNRWPTMLKTLSTALRQQQVDTEVIVVDDGSTDDTLARVGALEAPGLRVLHLPTSHGVARARNAGIAEARGEWLAFLDDDDVWAPHKLRRQLDRAAETRASFVYGACVGVSESGVILRTEPLPLADGLDWRLLVSNVIPAGASNIIARLELVRRIGGFDEKLDHLADWDLWIRLAQAGGGAACPDLLVGYVEHATNMHKSAGDEVAAEFDYLLAKHQAASSAHGVEFDGLVFFRGVAVRHLRAGRRLKAARVYLRCAIKFRNAGNVTRGLAALLGEPVVRRFRRDRAVGTRQPEWLRRAFEEPELRPPRALSYGSPPSRLNQPSERAARRATPGRGTGTAADLER
jgi:glycosyltransferase involved in cell wall biosynthesis